jgi:hypothetical protein
MPQDGPPILYLVRKPLRLYGQLQSVWFALPPAFAESELHVAITDCPSFDSLRVDFDRTDDAKAADGVCATRLAEYSLGVGTHVARLPTPFGPNVRVSLGSRDGGVGIWVAYLVGRAA